ncbi:microviridin/marinostatin family tricyclic proteinase inhibitor [Coleofasciculus sp. E1-EBD-02]
MSKNKELQVVPFFARFLEAQAPAPSEKAPVTTLKFPSDWEEY